MTQTTIITEEKHLKAIKKACNELEKTLFIGYHDYNIKGFVQVVISYEFDHSLFYIGQKIASYEG